MPGIYAEEKEPLTSREHERTGGAILYQPLVVRASDVALLCLVLQITKRKQAERQVGRLTRARNSLPLLNRFLILTGAHGIACQGHLRAQADRGIRRGIRHIAKRLLSRLFLATGKELHAAQQASRIGSPRIGVILRDLLKSGEVKTLILRSGRGNHANGGKQRAGSVLFLSGQVSAVHDGRGRSEHDRESENDQLLVVMIEESLMAGGAEFNLADSLHFLRREGRGIMFCSSVRCAHSGMREGKMDQDL